MKKPNLIIIDDNKAFTKSVAFVLKDFHVIETHSPSEAREKLDSTVDIILLDLVFDDKTPDRYEGLDFIPFLKQNTPDTPIVVLTNYPSIEHTVLAIKAGATDFLNKRDLKWSEWKVRLVNYAKSSHQIRMLKQRNQELENTTDDAHIHGISSSIDFLRLRLKDLAINSSDAVIFLTGETGTGKNHAARFIRKYSIRSGMPYREFSILELAESLVESELFGHEKGAFTGATQNKKGLFELADGGILFLDEIGDYDLRIQSKILRFVDDKMITPVGSGKSKQLDLLLILASNHDIPTLIKEKQFREDLYQRINRIRIELPSLQERIEDIPILTEYFFHHFREKEKTKLVSIEPTVMEVFSAYAWPGNIRELQSVIWDSCTKARLFGDTVLQTKHIKSEIIRGSNTKIIQILNPETLANQEKIALLKLQSIESALQQSFGQKAKAAEIIGINADQLRYKILKLFKEFPDLVKTHNHIVKYYKL
jgi:DNA-binding NtrC family response regulator